MADDRNGVHARRQCAPRTGYAAVWPALAFAVVVTLSGCASRGAVVEDVARHPAPIYQGTEVPTMYAEAPRTVTGSIPRPLAAVQAAVRQAFADFSIPVTVDNAGGQIGNPDFYRVRQFLGRPMTDLVSCGSGITGPNAASYRIYMSLIVTTKSEPSGGTAIGVLYQATARDMMNGTSGDRLVCGGTGVVEQRILERVRALTVR